ncbi:unnamed protein product [Adineta steineri]|uniref:Nose resistant-to-fluoxetine protein N-terminal domain-containing protein n=2 Tax=Adineta steineri TaxID=433720 RepID=A0A814C1U8_9BILA|nr:unnamed protein product [Adineta steineri]CAF3536960.1 unnamed protein product [Adineta steineri]
MLSFIFFLFCTLCPNIISHSSPYRFDLAIHRLNQYQKFLPINPTKDIPYNLTVEQMLQYNMFSSISNNKTTHCEQDFEIILQAALKSDMWAIKVIDAWGKPLPSGILKGNTFWVGSYDECLQPMYLPANKSFISQPFNTQHCVVSSKSSQSDPNSMPPIVLGICVPSSCDHHDVALLVQKLYKKTNITEDDIVCSTDPANGQQNLTAGAIATIIILSLLALLVLVGTSIDLLNDINAQLIGSKYLNESDSGTSSRDSPYVSLKSKSYMIFLAEFSALRTLRRIFTMKQKNDDNSFLFINGIRVLSLCWVIIGHSLAFGLFYTSNIVDVLVWSHNILFQLIINAVFSVDTFFVLSGFLTAVLFVRHVEKENKLSFRTMLLYYVHRYMRLTPAFLLVILVSINLTPYFGSGPVYPVKQGFEPEGCRNQYWWTSILYVGNIVKPDSMCLGIAWYLHNDMQFHWIAPLSLIPFVLGRKILSFFIAVFFVFIGIGSILTILLYYPDMSLNVLLAFNNVPGPTFYKNIYITPWCRISAYAVGILTGYFVMNTGRHYRINKYVKFFGTILMILFSLICIFTTYPDYILPDGLNRTILVIYQSLSRTLWAIVIGWVLFLCSVNQGGIVNKILSWPIWAPLSRLNYSCYLVHAVILNIILYNQKLPLYYQGHLIVNNFVSHIFFSYSASIVVAIFFETPFFIIEKKIFKR